MHKIYTFHWPRCLMPNLSLILLSKIIHSNKTIFSHKIFQTTRVFVSVINLTFLHIWVYISHSPVDEALTVPTKPFMVSTIVFVFNLFITSSSFWSIIWLLLSGLLILLHTSLVFYSHVQLPMVQGLPYWFMAVQPKTNWQI